MTTKVYETIVDRLALKILAVAATALIAMLAFMATGAHAATGKRVAMVIGNSAYKHAPQLANPSNDAADMASVLRSIGFVVVEGRDLTNRGMRDKIREFASELRGADVGMLFYAGHGLQVNGHNYLAPIDAKLDFESDLDFETIPLDFIQRQMEREVKTILLFLDACRDNPLTRSFKSASRSNGAGKGLAEIKSAPGTLIAFSTDPNNVALDGKGRNSPFTTALLDNIARENVEVQTMMTLVRKDVFDNTGEQQTPWINSSLLGAFYFVPGGNAENVASLESKKDGETSSRPASGQTFDNAKVEQLAWDTVKDSEDPDELQAFISTFGSSFYGKLARLKLQRIQEKAKASETATAEETTDAPEEQQVASLDTKPEAKEEATRKIEPERDPREVVRDIQQHLARLSCNPGGADGIWGRRSQRALDTFRRSAKLQLASTSPDADLLDQLEGYQGKGCPVARSCAAGQKMNSRGQCYTPKRQASATPQVQTRSARQQQVIVRQRQPDQQQVFIEQQPDQQQVIIQQQPPQQVFVPQHQQQVIVEQPVQQRRPGLGAAIGGLIGGAVSSCLLVGC